MSDFNEVKQIIKDRRFKQCEVAKAIGCNYSMFNKYLNGWIPLPAKYEGRLINFLQPKIIAPEKPKLKKLYAYEWQGSSCVEFLTYEKDCSDSNYIRKPEYDIEYK